MEHWGIIYNQGRCDMRKLRNFSDVHYPFPMAWSERTEISAKYLKDFSKVLEFGAGTGRLGEFLPDSVQYFPSDIVGRGKNFQVIDLNLSLKLEFKPDACVALGVLEYLQNLYFSLTEIRSVSRNFVFTYCATRPTFLAEFRRKMNKWKNSFNERELECLLNETGWNIGEHILIEQHKHYTQYLYVCHASE